MPTTAIRIGLLGYEGVQTLDLVGPLDAFAAANAAHAGAYSVMTVTLEGVPFVSETGLKITPDCSLEEAGPLDTLIVAGGAGLRRPEYGAVVAEAVRRRAPTLRRVVSVCTGIYGVAPSGLLDHRRATTHWRFAHDIAARFPAIRVDLDAIFIKDGPLYTSAGITAAIDVALALIDEDYGPKLALSVARDLVVYLKRSGGQRQYSEPLRFQSRASDRFDELAAWMTAHLSSDLLIETLADRVGLSPRQFSRRFAQSFGMSPSRQIEILRLDAARGYLAESNANMRQIAASVGFHSDDAFRRAFERRFGLSPTDYRRAFAPTDSTHLRD